MTSRVKPCQVSIGSLPPWDKYCSVLLCLRIWKTALPAQSVVWLCFCRFWCLQYWRAPESNYSKWDKYNHWINSPFPSRAIKIRFRFWWHPPYFFRRNIANSLWSRGAARGCCWFSRAETQRLRNWKHPEGDHWQNCDWQMRNVSVTTSALLELYQCLLQRWLTSPVRRLSQGKADGQKKPPIRTRRRDNRSDLTAPLTGNAQVVQKCMRAVHLNATRNECRRMMSNGNTADGFQTKGRYICIWRSLWKWDSFATLLRWSSLASLKASQMGHIWRLHVQIFSWLPIIYPKPCRT